MAAIASSLPRVRPSATPRLRDARMLVGGVLALAVFACGLGYWTFLAGPREVVVVARDVPAGATLGPADLATSRVRVDQGLAALLYPAEDLGSVAGRSTAEPLHAGALLLRPQLATQRPVPPGMVVAAIPLKAEAGPGLAARPGAHVRVIATVGHAGSPDATTAVVLPDAEVVEAVAPARSALLAGSETRSNTPGEPAVLRVLASEPDAEALAKAKVTGTLEVVLLGPPPAGGRP